MNHNKQKLIEIRQVDVLSEDAIGLVNALNQTLQEITGCSGANSFSNQDMLSERSVFLVAFDHEKAIGCGALREIDATTAEMKRVFAYPNQCGVGHIILESLEENAKNLGYQEIILETRKVNEKAVSFYLKNGYHICDNYGKYVGREDAICFAKCLI